MCYYVYIIMCSDNSLYTGITKDIIKRLNQHFFKTKESAKYTKSHQMISIKSLWKTETRSQASKLEYHIKKLTKNQKISLIDNNKNFEIYFSNKLNINEYIFIEKEKQLEIFSQVVLSN